MSGLSAVVAHLFWEQRVVSSNPTAPTIFSFCFYPMIFELPSPFVPEVLGHLPQDPGETRRSRHCEVPHWEGT